MKIAYSFIYYIYEKIDCFNLYFINNKMATEDNIISDFYMVNHHIFMLNLDKKTIIKLCQMH